MTCTKNTMRTNNRKTGECNFKLQNLVSATKEDALISSCSGIVSSNILWPQDNKYVFSWKYNLSMKSVMLKKHQLIVAMHIETLRISKFCFKMV